MNAGHVVSLLAFATTCLCALSLGRRVAHFTASRTLVTLVLPASFVLLGALGLLYIFFPNTKVPRPHSSERYAPSPSDRCSHGSSSRIP